MLQVRLLGTFDVRRDDTSISISSRPAQSLFAYLILSAGTSHRREKLVGLLGFARGDWQIPPQNGPIDVKLPSRAFIVLSTPNGYTYLHYW
jgi:hypothetical protein